MGVVSVGGMWSASELESASTGELVEGAAAALGVLAGRRVPDSPVVCLELAERLGIGLDAGEAALAALVAVADRAGEASAQKYPGTRGWLRVVLGMRAGRADERLTMAQQLERLPKVAEMLRKRKLSFGYASTIAEAVTHLDEVECGQAEAILLEMAGRGCTPTQVAKAGARIKDLIAERDGTEKPPEDARRGGRSWLRVAKSLNGGGLVKGWFAPELVALVRDRLGPLTKPTGPEDDRDHAQRMADALEMVLSGGSVHWNATLVIKLDDQPDQEGHAAQKGRAGRGGQSSAGGRQGDGAPSGRDGEPGGSRRHAESGRPAEDGGDGLPERGGRPGEGAHSPVRGEGGHDGLPAPAPPSDGEPVPAPVPGPASGRGESEGDGASAGGGLGQDRYAEKADGDDPVGSSVPAGSVLSSGSGDELFGEKVPAGDGPALSETGAGGSPAEHGSERAGYGGPSENDGAPDPIEGDRGSSGQVGSGRSSSGQVPHGQVRSGPVPFRRVPVWPLEDAQVTARLADGTPIPVERARIIALNAGISALILGKDGIPLYLGNKIRFVTAAQRRTLEALYETCAFLECDIPARLCQVDHVRNYSEDGTTDIDLLAPCCSFHNRLKYQNPDLVTVTRDARGLWEYTIERPCPKWRSNSADQARGP
ncbi:MAG: hypothetical protein JWN52_3735 [Actinomycetia bacterium]|nr:hypothetical protein [Actinomycetes bacterium]